jgi:hypothetical protein
MPLYVRAGSIVPFGPDLQYATEKAADPIELRVYRGSDGDFTLYEDAGDSYDYETGSRATIPFHWDETAKALTIGARSGSFPGMLASRTFKVIWVYAGHGAGMPADATADTTVTYSGAAVTVPMPNGGSAPTIPSNLLATPGAGQISLSWGAVTGAGSYLVKRATVSGGPYTTVATVTSPSYVDTGLSASSVYFYVIIAANASGQSMPSAQVSATPTGEPPINGWFSSDIGAVGISGSTTLLSGTYSMIASGVDITGTSDCFRFARRDFNGDGVIMARVGSLTNSNAWAKAGVMIRASDDANAAFAAMFVTPGQGVSFQWRSSAGANGASSFSQTTGITAPVWVKMVRSGTSFSGYTSSDGITWTQRGTTQSISIPAIVKAGMAVTSHDNTKTTTATISQISLFSSATWSARDIGSPALAGETEEQGGVFAMTGAGSDIWNTADQCQFASTAWTGDGQFIARVVDQTNTDSWSKAGIMVRASPSDAGAINCMLALTPGNGITFQSRSATNGSCTNSATTGLVAPYWLKITRIGNSFTASYSQDGNLWTQQGSSVTLASMPAATSVGLALTSHSANSIAAAHFDNLSFGAVPPKAPTNLAALALSSSQVQLTWVDAATDETRYVVDISPASTQGWANAAILPAGSTSFTVGNLVPSYAYDFRVRAENGTLYSPYALVTQTTLSVYQQWKASNGLALSTPDSSTPDGDGIPILMKFATAMPLGQSGANPITLVPAAGPLSISFKRLSPAPLSYIVERSTDLASWTPVSTLLNGSDTWSGSASVTQDATGSPRSVTVTDTLSPTTNSRVFLRLRVSQ